MTFRIEEKLYINKNQLTSFKEYLLTRSAKKIYKARKIESLYFDNIKYEMFNDSIEGTVPRKKIRIRNYPNNEDNKLYLEVKNSSVEGRFKTRKIIDKKEKLDYTNIGYLDNQYGICMPNYYVKYDREYLKKDDVRISIDTNLIYQDFKTKRFFYDDKVIVELKTSISKNQDDLMEDFPFQRIRFSKYCYAVQSLNVNHSTFL